MRKCVCYESKSGEPFPQDILVKHCKLVFVHIKADQNHWPLLSLKVSMASNPLKEKNKEWTPVLNSLA